MLATRRAALSSRRLFCRNPPLQKRYASQESHSSHSQSANESFGKGFYITVALVPVSVILYQTAQSATSTSPTGTGPSEPYLTTLLARFSEYVASPSADLSRRTALHAAAVEQAALDRHLFNGVEESHAIDLYSPESVLNRRSPINVAAGEQGADLRKLKRYYDEKHRQMEEERVRKVREQGGQVRTVYDTRGGWDRFKDKTDEVKYKGAGGPSV